MRPDGKGRITCQRSFRLRHLLTLGCPTRVPDPRVHRMKKYIIHIRTDPKTLRRYFQAQNDRGDFKLKDRRSEGTVMNRKDRNAILDHLQVMDFDAVGWIRKRKAA